ncbi:MAG: hypothetical protein HRU03_05090, partial [Nanoarchaeales archaeon]|nr:hypothetical protein [Nanoarchaeales archaeon]
MKTFTEIKFYVYSQKNNITKDNFRKLFDIIISEYFSNSIEINSIKIKNFNELFNF